MEMILPVDLQAEYEADKVEIDSAISAVLASGRYILGAEVDGFEREFADFLGCRHAIGVASGTDALVLALKAVGVGRGDYVVTVSHTAVATVAAIELAGAIPIFADVDERRYTMCPDSMREVLRTCLQQGLSVKAVLPVHLYGLPCDMAAIQSIAAEFGLKTVEDCSQSHGAGIGDRITGTFGHVAAFSLYPTKNLGALGDAGVVTTDDDQIADNIRLTRQYGWRTRNVSEIAGMNSRLDELQAAVLRVRLKKLKERTRRRCEIAAKYDHLLGDCCSLPHRIEGLHHVFHQYVIKTPRRDDVKRQLMDGGVSTMIHYPVPVHLQPAYRGRLQQPEQCTLAHTERIVHQILSLPMYPQLSDDSIHRISELLRRTV